MDLILSVPNESTCIGTLAFLSLHSSYETHSAVKRPNAVLYQRMRSATDKSKINSGCMQKHTRENKAALLYSEHYRVRVREIEKFKGKFVK